MGFAIRNELVSSIEGPRGITERIMTLRLSTACGFITVISAYAPTLGSPSQAKDQFYNSVSEVLRGVHSGDRLLILGDFNARVGSDCSPWPDCIGY